ncbi:MAG: hypothetical protein ACJ75S_11355 [Solirubrobacterales bacterium]
MAKLPIQLLARLGVDKAKDIEEIIDLVGEELSAVCEANRVDHREARGDNAHTYGTNNYHHLRFRLDGRLDGDSRGSMIHWKNAYKISVSPITLGIYALGSYGEDNINERFPDDSETKRDYGKQNRDQLTIFDVDFDAPLPPEAAYALDELIVGHFSNPREGLIKWYVGAYVIDDEGKRSWAWHERQDEAGEGFAPTPARSPVVPFSAAEVDSLEVRPRRDRAKRAE